MHNYVKVYKQNASKAHFLDFQLFKLNPFTSCQKNHAELLFTLLCSLKGRPINDNIKFTVVGIRNVSQCNDNIKSQKTTFRMKSRVLYIYVAVLSRSLTLNNMPNCLRVFSRNLNKFRLSFDFDLMANLNHINSHKM